MLQILKGLVTGKKVNICKSMSITSQLKKKEDTELGKSFHFDEVQFTYFFVACAFGAISENLSPIPWTQRSIAMFLSKIFMILAFAFRFMSDFLLILCWCKVGVLSCMQ